MTAQFSKVHEVMAGVNRGMDTERRQSLRLIHYWDHLRGNRIMPVEDDLDTDHEAIHDIWDHCFIVQMRDLINKEFNYTYLGPAIVDAYQEQLKGFNHEKMVSLSASKLISAYREVMVTKRPVIHSGEIDNGRGSMLKFRQSLLPLGKNDVEVIFGHVTFQVFGGLK